jgi:ketosteroid isomerase-like protein
MIKSEVIVDNFIGLYQRLNKQTLNIELLSNVYHNDIVFEDCLHHIEGILVLYNYFENLYENVDFIEFDFENRWFGEDSAMLTWVMKYKHPRLNKGEVIEVKGASHLQFLDGKIIRHRDYFDAGALLYEHIPLLKRIIKYLKSRLA